VRFWGAELRERERQRRALVSRESLQESRLGEGNSG